MVLFFSCCHYQLFYVCFSILVCLCSVQLLFSVVQDEDNPKYIYFFTKWSFMLLKMLLVPSENLSQFILEHEWFDRHISVQGTLMFLIYTQVLLCFFNFIYKVLEV